MLICSFLVISLVASVVYVHFTGFVVWKAVLLFAGAFLALNVLYLLFLGLAGLFVNSSKPITKQSELCRASCVGLSTLVLGYCHVRSHVSGMEELPADSKFLMVCNHRSVFDPLVILDKFRLFNIAFLSKPENMRLPVVGKIAYGAGFLPIDRENDRNALKSVLAAVNYLRKGICSMAVYPEGTRSKSGELLPFRAGSFKIAQKAGVPLVIASVRNTEKVFKNVFRGGTDVYIDILEVVPAEKVSSMSTAELSEYSRRLIGESLKEAA